MFPGKGVKTNPACSRPLTICSTVSACPLNWPGTGEAVENGSAAAWPTAVRDDFAEFVLAVHDSGLDLWIIADGQIRLGNKSGTRDRAEACLAWIIAQKNGPIISFSRLVAGADTPWEAVGKPALARLQAPGIP